MNIALWIDGDKQDDSESVEIAAGQGTSRRLLLRGAIGGFALAASGLFLPLGEDEAEARGALGGDKGGRRGNDNKGRHKKRSHGDKKDKNKGDGPRGAGPLFRSTALKVVNSSANPLQVEFYYRVKLSGDDYSAPIAADTKTLNPGTSFRYDPDRYRVGAVVRHALGSEDIHCDVRNISFFFPRGVVNHGANLNPVGGVFGTSLIPEQNFFENEEQQGENIVLHRLVDDSAGAKRIEWQLVIR